MSEHSSFVTRLSCLLAALFVLVAAGCKTSNEHQTEVMLAVAASMRNVTPELVEAFTAKHPEIKIAATYGASGDLRKQVEGGAPIDGVIFASKKPVDELIASGRVSSSSRKLLATNKLVLIGPKDATLVSFATLDELPPSVKIAIGDPGAVPAGQYARDYLIKIGKWTVLQRQLVFGGDVGAVLAYARRGEVAAAIVYRTETRGIEDIRVLDEAGANGPRTEVVAGVVTGAKAASSAAKFLDFVSSSDGQAILRHYGFGAP